MALTGAGQMIDRLARQGHLVGDGWTPSDGGGRYEHHDPATGQVQAEVLLGGAEEIERSVDAAAAAASSWRTTPLEARAAILYRLADLLDAHDDESAALNAHDNGTPVSAIRPGLYSAAWVRYYAGWIDKLEGRVVPVSGAGLDYVVPEPYGVIGAIVPWNGPMMGMGQKVGPALAAGNTVVVKPPEIAPFGALRFAGVGARGRTPAGGVERGGRRCRRRGGVGT